MAYYRFMSISRAFALSCLFSDIPDFFASQKNSRVGRKCSKLKIFPIIKNYFLNKCLKVFAVVFDVFRKNSRSMTLKKSLT